MIEFNGLAKNLNRRIRFFASHFVYAVLKNQLSSALENLCHRKHFVFVNIRYYIFVNRPSAFFDFLKFCERLSSAIALSPSRKS